MNLGRFKIEFWFSVPQVDDVSSFRRKCSCKTVKNCHAFIKGYIFSKTGVERVKYRIT